MNRAVKSHAPKREHKFTMLLTKKERADLQRIADEMGLTATDVIRQYIREQIASRAA